ncbi:TraR/DksA family transcriptional regulator [Enterobacter sp. DE0047]|uniref:TraR/DksA family transcriptional regulator n=1 Tax=Enterobacter sp. DE0047 TaxID=2584949 RepID=UPI0011AA907B|nr:TraR/DksA family transcriptional regulator [Enterobacter sp. DE0047]
MPAEIIDAASELEDMQREQAIAAHRIDRNAVSATHCSECCDDIPQPRREAVPGCRTCASCQEEIELKNKQRGSWV